MKVTINLRFFLASLVGFGLLGVAICFLHAFQLHRQSAFLLERARQAKSKKHLQACASRLPGLPENEPQRCFGLGRVWPPAGRRGQGKAGQPKSGDLRSAWPEREDLRKRLVQIDIDLGYYGNAREHLLLLLASSPRDGKLWERLGICQAGDGDDRAAIDSFEKAIDFDPAACEAYAHLATLLRQRAQRPRRADDWMAKLVAKNPDSSQAHALYARYLQEPVSSQGKAALAEAEKAVVPGRRILRSCCSPQTSARRKSTRRPAAMPIRAISVAQRGPADTVQFFASSWGRVTGRGLWPACVAASRRCSTRGNFSLT